MLIWKQIKMVVAALFVALLPLMYVVGIRRGTKNADADRMKDVAQKHKDLSDFYKDLGNRNENIDPPRTRNELVNRVRKEGL